MHNVMLTSCVSSCNSTMSQKQKGQMGFFFFMVWKLLFLGTILHSILVYHEAENSGNSSPVLKAYIHAQPDQIICEPSYIGYFKKKKKNWPDYQTSDWPFYLGPLPFPLNNALAQ